MPVDLNRLREIAPDVVGWISLNATVETASREWLTANGIFDTDRLLHGLDAIRAAEVNEVEKGVRDDS
jgi:hypothetical protein